MKQRVKHLYSKLAEKCGSRTSLMRYSLVLSFVTLLFYHFPLFNYILDNIEDGFNGVLIFVSMAVLMFVANYMVYYLLLYLGRVVGRYILALLFVTNALCLYFINGNNQLCFQTQKLPLYAPPLQGAQTDELLF